MVLGSIMANGICPAEISLNGPMVLNGIQWYSMVFNGIPLALFCKGIVLYDLMICYFITLCYFIQGAPAIHRQRR